MSSSGETVPRGAAPPESLEVVETPTSPSSSLALSRFEFETGKGNEGSKILMVEWDATAGAKTGSGEGGEELGAGTEVGNGKSDDWEVSWEGKTAILQVRDTDPEVGAHTHRVYYFLPPGAAIPTLVSIKRKGSSETETASGTPTVLRTKPMPAIFPAELVGGDEAGRRGVLHSIWAKRRLAELQAEIAAEMKENAESVGLEIAVQELQWIVDHFGLAAEQGVPKPTRLHIPTQNPLSPASPRSPLGGRLGEKLRGLKLATSPAELAAATQGTYGDTCCGYQVADTHI